jgi:very-short-patch-repair endonuclease
LTDPRAVPLKFRRARQLRGNQTDPERVLWSQLRARRLNGLRFRRQFPIGNFIADFCCKEYQLVIELDGGQHAEQQIIKNDGRRTQLIENRGYKVLRFWNNEVLTNMDGVLESIFEAVARQKPQRPLPRPLLGQGEGTEKEERIREEVRKD